MLVCCISLYMFYLMSCCHVIIPCIKMCVDWLVFLVCPPAIDLLKRALIIGMPLSWLMLKPCCIWLYFLPSEITYGYIPSYIPSLFALFFAAADISWLVYIFHKVDPHCCITWSLSVGWSSLMRFWCLSPWSCQSVTWRDNAGSFSLFWLSDDICIWRL